ncbi:MAG: hypothetical protein GTO41_17245, partial [Burkholderiales bacterium]|nr:hypothetical protein [Burkholderiales bacterium]
FGSGGYAGSTGSQSWATSWLEINESDGPTWGDEQVVLSDATGSLALRVRDNDGGGEGVQRELDLSPYTNATLTFVYVRSGLDTSEDYVALELS